MQHKTLLLHALLSFLVVLPLGCGEPDIVRCGGLVTLDGKPLEKAAVMFSPTDGRRPATGKTDANGRFKLTTFKPDDGALTGEHKVSVMAIEPVIPKSMSGSAGGGGGDEPEMIIDDESNQATIKWLAPRKYSRRETSGLSATVGSGQNDFTFELTSK